MIQYKTLLKGVKEHLDKIETYANFLDENSEIYKISQNSVQFQLTSQQGFLTELDKLILIVQWKRRGPRIKRKFRRRKS